MSRRDADQGAVKIAKTKQITRETWAQFGLPLPEAEVRFHSSRRWRLDFVWFPAYVAVEVDGGMFIGGRHITGAGAVADHEKLNHATLAGYRVLRVTPRQVRTGYAAEVVRAALYWTAEPSLPPLPEHGAKGRGRAAQGSLACHRRLSQ